MSHESALIGLDWGTSSLRAYLFGSSGEIIASRREPWGIMALPAAPERGGFALTLEQICEGWLSDNPKLPILACGMVGSGQGWKEAAYIDCPADTAALAGSLTSVSMAGQSGNRTIHIVPGLIARRNLPDVMRGEETQIAGAFAFIRETSQYDSATLVLPGTHSKWVRVNGNGIVDFTTFMTGEVFAALSQHTILGRLMSKDDSSFHDAAFERGVRTARTAGTGGVLASIFSTRTLCLTQELPGSELSDYLSGLLIGHEIVGIQEKQPTSSPIYLIGADELVRRYAKALAISDLEPISIQNATEVGLWQIASAAGFVTKEVVP